MAEIKLSDGTTIETDHGSAVEAANQVSETGWSDFQGVDGHHYLVAPSQVIYVRQLREGA